MIRFLIVSFLLTSLWPLSAAEREVTVRTLCFKRAKPEHRAVTTVTKANETIELPLWTSEPSDDIVFTVTKNRLNLYLSEPSPQDGSNPIANARIGMNPRYLLFFVPTGKKSPAYHVLSLPDDESSFPMGSTRLLNLTQSPALFQMGEHKIPVTPGKVVIAPMPRKVNKYNEYNLEIKLQTSRGLKPIRQTRGKSVTSKRNFIVLYNDNQNKRMRVNIYTDLPPWTLPSSER